MTGENLDTSQTDILIKDKTKKRQLDCNECSYTTTWGPNMLRKHVQVTHKGERFKCNQCYKEFKDKKYMNTHMKLVHFGHIQKKIPCAYCDYSSISKSVMKQHVNSVHYGVVYDCSHCEQTFSCSSYKEKHIQKIHLDKVHKCEKCEFVAMNFFKLKQHIKTDHENLMVRPKRKRRIFARDNSNQVKKVICKHCNFETISIRNLKEHRLSQHAFFICVDCDFKTDYGNLLTQHIDKIHSGKVYYCKHCDFTANYYQKWLYHEKSHIQEKLKCQYCDALYNHEQALNNHKRKVHSDQHNKIRKLTQKCQHCDFAGKLYRDLKLHRLQVHDIIEKVKPVTKRTIFRRKKRRKTKSDKETKVEYEVKSTNKLIITSNIQTEVKTESKTALESITTYDKAEHVNTLDEFKNNLITRFDDLTKVKLADDSKVIFDQITHVKKENIPVKDYINNCEKQILDESKESDRHKLVISRDTITNVKMKDSSSSEWIATYDTLTMKNPKISDDNLNCTICIYLGQLSDLANKQLLQEHVKMKHSL